MINAKNVYLMTIFIEKGYPTISLILRNSQLIIATISGQLK